MSRVCRGNVQVLSEPRQTSVKLRTTWTEIGQANPEIVQSLSTTIENCAISHPGQTLDRLLTWEIGAQGSDFGFLKKDIATLMLHWTEIRQTFDMDGPWTEFGHLIKYSNCYQVPGGPQVSSRRATGGLLVGHRWAPGGPFDWSLKI